MCAALKDASSFVFWLVSHSQLVDMGNHGSKGCVLVKHCTVVRKCMLIVDRVSYPWWSKRYCLVADNVNHCVVWCALLKQRTVVRKCMRTVFSIVMSYLVGIVCCFVPLGPACCATHSASPWASTTTLMARTTWLDRAVHEPPKATP